MNGLSAWWALLAIPYLGVPAAVLVLGSHLDEGRRRERPAGWQARCATALWVAFWPFLLSLHAAVAVAGRIRNLLVARLLGPVADETVWNAFTISELVRAVQAHRSGPGRLEMWTRRSGRDATSRVMAVTRSPREVVAAALGRYAGLREGMDTGAVMAAETARRGHRPTGPSAAGAAYRLRAEIVE